MSEISDTIQQKYLAFSDRIIKLNDYLLKEAANKNHHMDDKQYQSIYSDCEELVKILVSRCKTLNDYKETMNT